MKTSALFMKGWSTLVCSVTKGQVQGDVLTNTKYQATSKSNTSTLVGAGVIGIVWTKLIFDFGIVGGIGGFNGDSAMELSNMSLDWSIGSGVSCKNVTCGIESSKRTYTRK